jgi:hypothetical protein
MDQPDVKDEVIATYQAYTRAFLANDMDAINELVLDPLAYVGPGKAALLDSFPVTPADLIASKQWHTTTDMEIEVVGVSSTKAHLILPHAKRLRADGSLIETVSAFYAFTKIDGRWKMFALSDITVPA